MDLDIDQPDDRALLAWLVRTKCHICLELELAGVTLSPKLTDDNDYLALECGTPADHAWFSAAVRYPDVPHSDLWGQFDPIWGPQPPPPGSKITLYVFRGDLAAVHQRLKEVNARTVPDYAAKKRQAIMRTGYYHA